jgi:stress-induced morphogen
MAVDQKKVISLLEEAFPKASINLEDLRGNQDYYQVTISCASFNGKSRVQQHQMVYNSLKGYVGDYIHALSIKTLEKH